MSRGFNMWNYMTYHLVHDYFKAKKKKKTEIQNFEVKNYKAAQKAAEEAAREAARQAAHRRLVIRLTCVGAFSALVIALAVVLIRKLHKAGRC